MPPNKPSSNKASRRKRGARQSPAADETALPVASNGKAALAVTRDRVWRMTQIPAATQSRFSKAMTAYMRHASLMELGPSVALIDACIDDLLVRVDEGDDREWRSKVLKRVQSVRAARARGDQAGATVLLAKLEAYVEHGADLDRCRARAVDYAERRNKLAKEARELACREAQTLTYRQAQELVANLFAVVREVLGEDIVTANLVIAAVSRLMSAELGMTVRGGATREEAAEVIRQVREDEGAIEVGS